MAIGGVVGATFIFYQIFLRNKTNQNQFIPRIKTSRFIPQSKTDIFTCPYCKTRNRVIKEKSKQARCGNRECKKPLFWFKE